MDRFDPQDFQEEEKKGFLKKLFSKSKEQLERILSKYDTMNKEVDAVYNEIQKYELEMKNNTVQLEQMYDENLNYFHSLSEHIAAIDVKVTELQNQLPTLTSRADAGDQEAMLEIETITRGIELLQQRGYDLEMAQVLGTSVEYLCGESDEMHPVDYVVTSDSPELYEIVDKYVEYGAKEIGLKDMAGIGRPKTLGKLVKAIKEKYPQIVVQYHGHTGPGLSMASVLEVCENGADIIDVAMEPLSWGMVHPDVIAVQAMLRDAGFQVKDINMTAYMEARALTQKFMDDFLGYFIEPKNKICTSLLLGCGLPGGMMGSMMADLKGLKDAINMALRKNNQKELSEDELLVKLFDEVQYVWPRVGTPGLVTPFSQYVKNIALMNILAEAQGKPRYSNMDDKMWDMILGRCGRLPGPLAPEILELAKEKGFEFFDGVPQDNYPDELPKYRAMMEEKGWDCGPDDEELFELAMHERQYIDYKEGRAKKNFEMALAQAKEKSNIREVVKIVKLPEVVKQEVIDKVLAKEPDAKMIVAPVSGQMIWELAVEEQSMAKPLGTAYKENDVVCFIQTYYGQEEVHAPYAGKLIEVLVKQGEKVQKGDVIAFIK